MAALTKFYDFANQLCRGVHDLAGHELRVALTTSLPLATYKNIGEVNQVAGQSYPAGGFLLGPESSSRVAPSNGKARLVLDDLVLAGGEFGVPAFRYAVVYNATVAGGPLIGWIDCGEVIELKPYDEFTLNFAEVAEGGALTVE